MIDWKCWGQLYEIGWILLSNFPLSFSFVRDSQCARAMDHPCGCASMNRRVERQIKRFRSRLHATGTNTPMGVVFVILSSLCTSIATYTVHVRKQRAHIDTHTRFKSLHTQHNWTKSTTDWAELRLCWCDEKRGQPAHGDASKRPPRYISKLFLQELDVGSPLPRTVYLWCFCPGCAEHSAVKCMPKVKRKNNISKGLCVLCLLFHLRHLRVYCEFAIYFAISFLIRYFRRLCRLCGIEVKHSRTN